MTGGRGRETERERGESDDQIELIKQLVRLFLKRFPSASEERVHRLPAAESCRRDVRSEIDIWHKRSITRSKVSALTRERRETAMMAIDF